MWRKLHHLPGLLLQQALPTGEDAVSPIVKQREKNMRIPNLRLRRGDDGALLPSMGAGRYRGLYLLRVRRADSGLDGGGISRRTVIDPTRLFLD